MAWLKRLIIEIHRRSLWQILAVYLGASWVALQVVHTLTESAGLPEWFPAFAVAVLVLLLPIVLATAFVQEGGPTRRGADDVAEGRRAATVGSAPDDVTDDRGRQGSEIEATRSGSALDARAAPRVHRLFTWRNATMGAVAAFALWGVVAAGWILTARTSNVLAGPGASPEASATSGGDAAPAAVLLLRTEPAAATATATPIWAMDRILSALPVELGTSPLKRELRAGEYLIQLSADHHNPLEFLVRLEAGREMEVHRALVPLTPETAGMVHVDAGTTARGEEILTVPAFLIDRTEVTNAMYLDFVNAGGYEDPDLWPETMVLDGRPVHRSEALATFVDRTGSSAPRGWSGGLFPEGLADHPVSGVSWYEASAYARWTGKRLPTWSEWWRAAVGDGAMPFPWGDDPAGFVTRANFGNDSTEPVGSRPGGVSLFGAHDMAGNVREWLRDASDDPGRRMVVGGAWQDPSYVFDQDWVEAFVPGYASDTIGFRCVKPLP